MPADCAPELFELMMECWHDETEKRPTFAHLVSRFDQFVKGHREVYFAFFLIPQVLFLLVGEQIRKKIQPSDATKHFLQPRTFFNNESWLQIEPR